ncbi:MAG: nucleotidyl transferase AbiEii/AbiGii toxin family protein [Candidatus Sungbacteria bacterium]|nr:nucleotidyl transferase AbiEii/AbiGii toxin family protein [Candidatus Sungbacteria bacterium]
MGEQISEILKRRLDDFAGGGDPEVSVNALKGELQYFALNFIYHHAEYGKWIMYGGTALRIIHALDRMSVDLDFEIDHEVEEDFLSTLKREIENHFLNVHGAGPDFLTIKVTNKRGLTLKFRVGKLIAGFASEWVYLKIDLNHFVAPKTVIEHRQINRGQFSFVVLTYNMGALMASKIAAIFLRDQRGRDKNIYDYKGHDIYDLLWYMRKNVVPDFDYLNAKLKEKDIEMPNMKTLFSKLTIDILNYEKMDDLLKDDLKNLFENPFQFPNWLSNWREEYLRFLDDYKIRTVTGLQKVIVDEDAATDNFSFTYFYDTEEGITVSIAYVVTWEWIKYQKVLGVPADENVVKLSVLRSGELNDQHKQFLTLFHRKTEAYFRKTNRIMLGDSIKTKTIRTTATNFNPKEQILLDKSALLSGELDDLLK